MTELFRNLSYYSMKVIIDSLIEEIIENKINKTICDRYKLLKL